jgi:hypothetical protein
MHPCRHYYLNKLRERLVIDNDNGGAPLSIRSNLAMVAAIR